MSTTCAELPCFQDPDLPPEATAEPVAMTPAEEILERIFNLPMYLTICKQDTFVALLVQWRSYARAAGYGLHRPFTTQSPPEFDNNNMYSEPMRPEESCLRPCPGPCRRNNEGSLPPTPAADAPTLKDAWGDYSPGPPCESFIIRGTVYHWTIQRCLISLCTTTEKDIALEGLLPETTFTVHVKSFRRFGEEVVTSDAISGEFDTCKTIL